MRRDLWHKAAVVSGDIVGSCREQISGKGEESIEGQTFGILANNFATQEGGARLFEYGTCCGKGDSCLRVHYDIIGAMVSQRILPSEVLRWSKKNLLMLDITPALGESTWSTKLGQMPVTYNTALALTAPLFPQVISQLNGALLSRGAKISVRTR